MRDQEAKRAYMRAYRLRVPVKPCLRCGGPKPRGAGLQYCTECVGKPDHWSTLEACIADQARDMHRGPHTEHERQRFGVTSITRTRTLSIDYSTRDGWEPADVWSDPTADEAIARMCPQRSRSEAIS